MSQLKLTAISSYCNGRKQVAFAMLPTHDCVRMGKLDVKTVADSLVIQRYLLEPFTADQRGVTYSIG